MAIAFVQKVTASGAGVNSQAATLTGVAAGSFLALMPSVFVTGNPPNATPTDDRSNTWNTTTAPTVIAEASAFIDYAMKVAAGTTIVTVDYGTTFYIQESLSEYSGVATSAAIDVQTSNSGTTTTPTSGTTGTTAEAEELVLACLMDNVTDTDAEIDVPAITGYTNLHVFQDASTIIGHASDYKIVAATGTQSAAWGTLVVGSNSWNAKIATFKSEPVRVPAYNVSRPSLATMDDAIGYRQMLDVRAWV